MKITETHLNMIKRYCEIHGIDYQYQVGNGLLGKYESCVAICDNFFLDDGLGLFVLGYDNKHKDEVDYLKKIGSYFINQGKEQDKLLKGKIISWINIHGITHIKAY